MFFRGQMNKTQFFYFFVLLLDVAHSLIALLNMVQVNFLCPLHTVCCLPILEPCYILHFIPFQCFYTPYLFNLLLCSHLQPISVVISNPSATCSNKIFSCSEILPPPTPPPSSKKLSELLVQLFDKLLKYRMIS